MLIISETNSVIDIYIYINAHFIYICANYSAYVEILIVLLTDMGLLSNRVII